VAVARRHGVEVGEPRVLSDRSNLMVHLSPAPLVARVATTTALVRAGGALDWLARDVALAEFLASAEVVPPSADPPAGPHREDGLAISFWPLVEHERARPDAAAAGAALRRLHDGLAGFPGELPPFEAVLDECEAVIGLLEGRAAAPQAILIHLRAALDAIRAGVAAAGRPPHPLHGDATPSNLLRTRRGLLWTDFEDACAGPVEWDLACLVCSAGPEALEAYGRDPGDETLEPFMNARRLQLTVWTALLAESHPELRDHAGERLRVWGPP
jgi:hypothetical protein